MTRFAGSPQHGIHTEVHVGHHVTQQDDRHKLPGIGQRHLRSSKEKEDGVQEHQAHHHEDKADNQVQRHGITQQILCPLVVALSQLDGNTRRGTHAHSRSECRTKVHERKRDAKTGYSLRTHQLSNKGPVNDVIET